MEQTGFLDIIKFNLGWMAWTKQTGIFFIIVFSSIILLGVLEKIYPSSKPRKGILGLTTTRGDRLFLSYLGSAYIGLLWLFFFGSPLTGALMVMAAFVIVVFKFV